MTLESRIHELDLDPRSFNLLFRNGYLTIEDVCARTEKQLRAVDGLGPKSLENIKNALAEAGFSLAG